MGASCWSRFFQSGAVTDASLFSRRYSARSAFFDLLPVVGTAELGGSDLVFGDASREIMPTRSIGPQHEVKITCFVGVESGQKRILPGIGDWTRRQTCVPERIRFWPLSTPTKQGIFTLCCGPMDRDRKSTRL